MIYRDKIYTVFLADYTPNWNLQDNVTSQSHVRKEHITIIIVWHNKDYRKFVYMQL